MAELLAKSRDLPKICAPQMQTSLYICKAECRSLWNLKAAILFWKKLLKGLMTQEFTINLYHWCVVNKMINGSQSTIIWHVDDLMLSHKSSRVVDSIIAWLESEYSRVDKMMIRQGKVHNYLGMRLDFFKPGKVMVDIEAYLDEIFHHLPSDMDGNTTTPSAEHLLKTHSNAGMLDKETAHFFHHVTEKFLFLCRRA